jgi:putative acetyltransferase
MLEQVSLTAAPLKQYPTSKKVFDVIEIRSTTVTTMVPSTNWRFRLSNAKDFDRLYDVWHASVNATHDFLSQSDLEAICIQVKDDYLPNNAVLVAVDDQDGVIGFIGMNGREIDSLFIDPRYRGIGLGRAFIETVATKSPCLEVEVNTQNKQAVAFYEAVGFSAYASSPTDDEGRPYPILHMRKNCSQQQSELRWE